MKLTQNHIEHLQDMLQQGLITASQANVEKVKMARVQLVLNSLPSQVRKALNAAVKTGEINHWKKDGKKPEVYFHKDFEHLAKQARSEDEHKIKNATKRILAVS